MMRKKESKKKKKLWRKELERKNEWWAKKTGWLFGISSFVGYLMPNPFLYK